LIGIVLGPILMWVSPEEVDPITPFLTTLTLMMILFFSVSCWETTGKFSGF
jgi:hypothetical protein